MSLSSGSRLLREGCSRKKLEPGSCPEYRRSESRLGWRCEVKSDAKVEQKKISRTTTTTTTTTTSGTRSRKPVGGPAEAARRAVRDAMLVCEAAQNIDVRARNDFLLLSQYGSNRNSVVLAMICIALPSNLAMSLVVRSSVASNGGGLDKYVCRHIVRLDMRAREGVARLGSNFLKLDGTMRSLALGIVEAVFLIAAVGTFSEPSLHRAPHVVVCDLNLVLDASPSLQLGHEKTWRSWTRERARR